MTSDKVLSRTTASAVVDSWTAKKLSAALILGLFIIETAIFYATFTRRYAPFYPMYEDQLSYYFATYAIIEKGWLGVIDEFIHVTDAAGVNLTAQGAILGLLFGANRTVIISLNLLYFLALQWALFRVICARTRSVELGWISLALLISCQTIFIGIGGIFDFRIDFSALCLYGIWVSSILWSETFRHTARSVVVAGAAILLISFRFFTVLYVAAILGGLLTIFGWTALAGSSAVDRSLARLRSRNLLAAGAGIAVIIGPLLFNARDVIYGYYIIGHVIGDEKYVRAQLEGLYTVLDHILYYPKSVYGDHLGWPSLALMSCVFAAAFLLARPWFSYRSILGCLRRYGLDLVLLFTACLFPLVPLTADIAKSPVVGGIVTVPIVTFVTFLCALFWQLSPGAAVNDAAEARIPAVKSAAAVRRPLEALRVTVVIVAVAIGLGCFVARGLMPPDEAPVADLRRITELNDVIAEYVVQNGLTEPGISVDRDADYINLPSVRLFTVERYHRVVAFVPLFGDIVATPRDMAMDLIKKSDIIVLTDPARGREGNPFDKKIVEYWDEIDAWTRRNRRLLHSTVIFGIPHAVYVRSPGDAMQRP
jgi:hypothetical protein